MRSLKILAAALALLCVSAPAVATVTINVTTNIDEANSRTSNTGTDNYPLSQGCSLREAMANVDAGNNTQYPECTPAPETGPTANNIIDLTGAGGTIVVNSSVKDPTDVNGSAMTNNGNLPDVFSTSSIGKLSITGGAVSCTSDPISNDGVRIFHVVSGDLTLTAMSVSSCTASAQGVGVDSSSGSSNLTLTNVNFLTIRSKSGTTGGCVNHGNGNLTITNTTFTACVMDDDSGLPGFGAGSGGALAVGGVGFSTTATLTNVTFTGNIAGTSGGALYLSGTDAIAITNSAFTGNIANGNTFDSGNAEVGGGAIFASNTANGGHTAPDVPSLFSILNSGFAGNLAPTGTGGAIILTGQGKLTYGNLLPGDGSGFPTNIPGGIIASNFSGNVASGTWNTQANNPSNRAGSGGAIYASGVLTVIDSSFVAGNASTNASGGAIAYYDPTNAFAPMSIANTTFNGNSAAVNGGAIANIKDPANNSNGQITLVNDTLSGDSAGASGGGEIFNVGVAADVTASNTIFANSGGGGNCSGPITDTVANLQFPGTDCGATMTSGDPQLAAASIFGGVNALVFTMDLGAASLASKNGDPATCAAAPIYNLDEALNSRPQPVATKCDIGAFESAETTPVRLQSFIVE